MDQLRCDTLTGFSQSGCVFVNSAPTYIFNAVKHPQAAAHAWLVQELTPNHPGSKGQTKPLYYMGNTSQKNLNRGRICPTGWAKDNGDTSALNATGDTALNCDEFAFASTYNSGGMAKSEGGLNEAVPTGSTTGKPNGSACIQSFAKKHGSAIHLYNIEGNIPTLHEVCGRSAISGAQNRDSVGSRNAKFLKDMRIIDGDPYWLDHRMTENCKYKDALGEPILPVICMMTAK